MSNSKTMQGSELVIEFLSMIRANFGQDAAHTLEKHVVELTGQTVPELNLSNEEANALVEKLLKLNSQKVDALGVLAFVSL